MTNPKLDQIHDATKTPLTAKVSISLHPGSLVPHGGALTEDDSPLASSVYQAGCTALRAMHENLLLMENAHTDMSVPVNIARPGSGGQVLRSEIPVARRPELAAALGTAFIRGARAYDANRNLIEESIGKLDNDIERALKDAGGADKASAREIRSVIREMSKHERVAAVHDAIKAGDLEIVKAVLTATPFASRLERSEHTMLKQLAAEKFCQKESKQRQHAIQVLAKVDKASDLYSARFAKLQPKVEEAPAEKSLRRLKEGV